MVERKNIKDIVYKRASGGLLNPPHEQDKIIVLDNGIVLKKRKDAFDYREGLK